MYDECSYWDLQPAVLGKWSMWSYSTLLRNLCLNMMVCGGGGVRGRDCGGDGDNDDNDDDDGWWERHRHVRIEERENVEKCHDMALEL